MRTFFKPKILFVSATILLILLNSRLNAQTTGKIIGKVTDAETNQPLVGANVIIEGTTMGAATDLNGDFYIINIPPGTYNLRVQMMGYQPYLIQNVIVSVNRSSTVNATLKQTVIEGEATVKFA